MLKKGVFMKKTVSFEKDLNFQTMIGEVSSISLDHDLKFVDSSNVSGKFIISGKYKMTEASRLEEDFSFEIPTQIALLESYDLSTTKIQIADFTYEIIDDDTLRARIDVLLEGVEEVKLDDDVTSDDDVTLEEVVTKIDDIPLRDCDGEMNNEVEIPVKSNKDEVIKSDGLNDLGSFDDIKSKTADLNTKNGDSDMSGNLSNKNNDLDNKNNNLEKDDSVNNNLMSSEKDNNKDNGLNISNNINNINDNNSFGNTNNNLINNVNSSSDSLGNTNNNLINNVNSSSDSINNGYNGDGLGNINNMNQKVSSLDNGKSVGSLFSNLADDDDTFKTYSIHIMRDGDNLGDIMERYKVSREELENYNDLSNIQVNSKVIIPTDLVDEE